MSSRPRILVVYKKTTYQRYRGGSSERLTKLLAENDVSVENLVEEHESHLETLERTRAVLERLGADATFEHDHQPTSAGPWDLVVTVGGDGTLLWNSHAVGADTKMVAINSAPKTSVGYFCAGRRENVEETLTAALEGRLKATRLSRMQVQIDGEIVSKRILNDILFSHSCPAAASKYVLRVGDVEESQLSSGIWAGPAAGSTAAQRSAGGRVLPIGSRKIQWVVREPYHGLEERFALVRGVIGPGEAIVIKSKMREGVIYLDGANRVIPVDIGSVITLEESNEPLHLLGLERRHREHPHRAALARDPLIDS
ncbi:MAG: NAD(+) kinase [Myxococcales bacterium]|nr:NAD(+) kinase [Myxococcales bacterium]